MLGIPLPLNQWSHAWQTLRSCWAVGPALQSNSSNCLVLILHRQLGNYLRSTGESYGPTAEHMQDWLKVNVWHLIGEDLLTKAQHGMLHRVLMPIHSSNVGREIVPSLCRNSGQITCLQDGHQRDTSYQGCRSSNPLERSQRHMCLSNMENFPYPRRNGFSTDRLMLPIVTQKKRSHLRSIWLLPK